MTGYTVHNEDCLDGLKKLPNESVHCCVTSPPYWRLRDYGHDGQIGLEETPELYVERLVEVFREVWRVLRDDGTLWLNLGDSYSNGGRRTRVKAKNLIGIPWRVAFALQEEGWYLRQDIIWHKPNPMPESVRDRCTKAHEYIFLMSKQRRYYYNYEAVREPAVYGGNEARYARAAKANKSLPTSERNGIRPRSWKGSDFHNGRNLLIHPNVGKKRGWNEKPSGDPGAHGAFHREDRAKKKSGNKERKPGTSRGCPDGSGSNVCGSVPWEGERRNKRSVWAVSAKPYKEAHFATFPPDLIEPCILAGCPVGGTVLDPFSGAGTTGLVAVQHGRLYIGYEINPEYIAMSRRRIGCIAICE